MTTTTDAIEIRPGRHTAGTDDIAFDALRVQIGDRLVLPGEPGWDEVSLAWNLAIDQAPCAVVLASSTDDVAAAIRFARAYGLTVAPQAGGHGASGRLRGSIVVRSSGLDEIDVDVVGRVARVGAGVRWGQLQARLDGTGLTGMIGSNPDVSVVGYTLQGGYSWFTRAFGMGSDSLRAAEIVDADGRLRRIDDTSDPELMWALRGGGGNVAYVTAVEIDLHPAPRIAGGRLVFDIADARDVLEAFATATSETADTVSLWASIAHMPDAPFLPAEIRGRSLVTVDACASDGIGPLERALAPIRAAGTVQHDTMRVRTAAEVGDICEEPVDPMPAAHRAVPLGEVTPATVDAVLAAVGRPGPVMQLQIRHLGPARPGHRDGFVTAVPSTFVATALALVPDPAVEAVIRDAFDGVAATLRPWTAGSVASTLVAAWDTLERTASYSDRALLAEVMADADPTGTFTAAVGLV
ncbi:FAD binding domain-containing protein [Mumia flava]|uniref:FAD binding domain-containing protein n=1 Tax=Mumia flava TaxID=1348852 RepID=A0A2M9BGT3_9ACTN|nr:FAD-binding oxidoreductase [Mumia flava]PJJ57165.1 FAD binding domain-containing protein [Mumia flava]